MPSIPSLTAQAALLTITGLFRQQVARHPERVALECDGQRWTYRELGERVDRLARALTARGLRCGDRIAILSENRADYVELELAVAQIGVVLACQNWRQSDAELEHCIRLVSPALLVHSQRQAEVAGRIDHGVAQVLNLDQDYAALVAPPLSAQPVDPAQPASTPADIDPETGLVILYTSGTTGLPKAARITHMRAQLYMRGFAGSTGANEKDRVYNTLPLYHATGGLCAMGAALLTGGSVVLKKKFSASQFWPEVAAEGCTMFVYIGELCRYLVNQAPCEDETRHKVRMAFGNGLRPDVWEQMKLRFRIPEILEFYGSTEGNVSLFNFDGRQGAIGRIPKYLRKRFNVRLVQFDVETEAELRGPSGLCIEAGVGQIGECVGHIGNDGRSNYTGYTDKAASEKKILHDVFQKGDSWFRTGDLMKMDADGYLYFVDRIGDTFRWKGETVSTGEVAGRLSAAPGVEEVNVYGVSVGEADGRAGMASLVTGPDFDLTAFADFVDRELPAYSRPMFVRLQPKIETTGTFKYRKVDLVTEGFDPAKTRDPIYFRQPGKGYVKITKAGYAKIVGGGFKI
jgi:fatty-acyl-CoA synthase